MNRFHRFRVSRVLRFSLAGFLVVAPACNTEVDLFLPGDPVPIVYCLLNPDSSHQYVRIGQTYMIPLDNPDYKPSSEDLLIQEEVEVYLAAEYSDSRQDIYYGKLINPYPKDSGLFPQEANQVYRIDCKLLPACSYSLYIHFLESNRVVYAQTKSFGTGFTILDPEPVLGRSVNLFHNQDFFVRFVPVTYGSIYQSTMTFRYDELYQGARVHRSLVLPQKLITEADTTRKFIEQRISGERFLIDISRFIQPSEGVARIPVGFDFYITCGGDDLAIKINAENNTQSFSVLEVNSFDNAFGVFSCMSHRHVSGFPVSPFTMDTLALSALTRSLGFLTAAAIDSLNHEKNN
ncbi:MAG: hypothetical protein A2X22_11730 [Bacteroidetes bacterium GWF2_49_14]|nr:MAG: hypothetical protein A2X22_11730 [Bacteroidetes bacterium GWF2_49_14]HBB92805.1 hypothetical protein [Bacteroidales bacterium]